MGACHIEVTLKCSACLENGFSITLMSQSLPHLSSSVIEVRLSKKNKQEDKKKSHIGILFSAILNSTRISGSLHTKAKPNKSPQIRFLFFFSFQT